MIPLPFLRIRWIASCLPGEQAINNPSRAYLSDGTWQELYPGLMLDTGHLLNMRVLYLNIAHILIF